MHNPPLKLGGEIIAGLQTTFTTPSALTSRAISSLLSHCDLS
uniref:Uncharacterized protein n=1 Tax=Anguilla anguilla TaxID=7936 RepID=A0A0E9SR47_ANGAN